MYIVTKPMTVTDATIACMEARKVAKLDKKRQDIKKLQQSLVTCFAHWELQKILKYMEPNFYPMWYEASNEQLGRKLVYGGVE